MSQTKYLVVVVGPTAVGKTSFSVRLAQHFQTEVLSADARQLFRELEIGTAKPTETEMQGVPHHFVGSHSITEPYSVGDFEQEALALLSRLFGRHEVVVMAGGSGLYVRAVCEGLDEMPAADPELRAQLQQRLSEQGLQELVRELERLDPAFAAQIDRANPQRVLRALEVCLRTGQPFSSFRTGAKTPRPFRVIKIGLTRDRVELYARIDQRMDQMLHQGLLEEASRLLPYRHHNALQTVGYSEIFDFLEGACSWEETVRLLKRNSRRYAKRQLTWFRKDIETTWFHPDEWEQVLHHLHARMLEPQQRA